MHKYLVNFKKSASDRAAEISARAYNHYKRIKPFFLGKFYGQGKKGIKFPR